MTSCQRRTIARTIGSELFHLTGRGTTALWASLRALATPGSCVLVPANVCEVVIVAITEARLVPVYVDVDAIGGNVSIANLERAWTPRCTTLIAVHNFGTPLPIDAVMRWARRRGLSVIEDCACALGATRLGAPLGTFGDAAVYSFGRAKTLAVGMGGAVTTRDPRLLRDIRRITGPLPPWSANHAVRDQAFQSLLRIMRRHAVLRDPALYRALYARYAPTLLAAAPPELAGRIADAARRLPEVLAQRRDGATRHRRRLQHHLIRHRRAIEGEVCWRYTFHVPCNMQKRVVADLRSRRLPISTWFPAVDHCFGCRAPSVALDGADQFGGSVVNLFVAPEAPQADADAADDAVMTALDSAEPRERNT